MHTSQGWTLNLNWSDKKSNDKEMALLLNSVLRTSVQWYIIIFPTCPHLKHGSIYLNTNNVKGNCEFAGGSSYRG